MVAVIDVYGCVFALVAGRNTTNEELESMLESDNPAIFTSGVSDTTNATQMHTKHVFRFNSSLSLSFCCTILDHHGQHHRASYE